MEDDASGAAWASTSARTLARRLRRKMRQQMGKSRSQALAERGRAVRLALEAQWKLQDRLGCTCRTFGEAVEAARLAKLAGLEECGELLALGNWARHAPPPLAHPALPKSPVQGMQSSVLEQFRAQLFVGDSCTAVEGSPDEKLHVDEVTDKQEEDMDNELDSNLITNVCDAADIKAEEGLHSGSRTPACEDGDDEVPKNEAEHGREPVHDSWYKPGKTGDEDLARMSMAAFGGVADIFGGRVKVQGTVDENKAKEEHNCYVIKCSDDREAITFHEYKRVADMLARHLSAEESVGKGLKEEDLIGWYMHHLSREAHSEDQSRKQLGLLKQIIQRMIDKDGVILVLRDADYDLRPEKRVLIKHPKYPV